MNNTYLRPLEQEDILVKKKRQEIIKLRAEINEIERGKQTKLAKNQ